MSQKKPMQNCPSCGTAHSKKGCPPGSANLVPKGDFLTPSVVVLGIGAAIFLLLMRKTDPTKKKPQSKEANFAPMSFGF